MLNQQITTEEALEREIAGLYNLLTTGCWILEGITISEDPAEQIKVEKESIEFFLNSSSDMLSSITDQYMQIAKKYTRPDEGAIAVWVKGRGMAVDVGYYCARCRHFQSCELEGKRMKDNSISHCYERKLTMRDN